LSRGRATVGRVRQWPGTPRDASQILYEAIWNEYCDWGVELAKIRLADESLTPAERERWWTLVGVLDTYLRLLHPSCPSLPRRSGTVPHSAADPALFDRGDWPASAPGSGLGRRGRGGGPDELSGRAKCPGRGSCEPAAWLPECLRSRIPGRHVRTRSVPTSAGSGEALGREWTSKRSNGRKAVCGHRRRGRSGRARPRRTMRRKIVTALAGAGACGRLKDSWRRPELGSPTILHVEGRRRGRGGVRARARTAELGVTTRPAAVVGAGACCGAGVTRGRGSATAGRLSRWDRGKASPGGGAGRIRVAGPLQEGKVPLLR